MDSHLKLAKLLAKFLDEEFKVLGVKFGFDPLIGLIPIVGDLLGLALSFYIIWIGVQMRIPHEAVSQMVANSITDFLLGIVPGVGDLADFIYKANTKNLKILEKYAMQGIIVEAELVT